MSITIHEIRDTHTVKGPRVPVPRVTRKSAKEMQNWRHEKMRDEINEAKANLKGEALVAWYALQGLVG